MGNTLYCPLFISDPSFLISIVEFEDKTGFERNLKSDVVLTDEDKCVNAIAPENNIRAITMAEIYLYIFFILIRF
jgi:hypothetical protein